MFKILSLACGFLFITLTMGRLIFQGWLEKPSFAPHLEAGAGDFGLLVQCLLALATVLLSLGWLSFWRSGKEAGIAIGLAIIAPSLFAYTARGLQQFAPGYSTETFEILASQRLGGRPLREIDIRVRLGEPLLRRPTEDGGQYWLYSYMPSCGFGWDKKNVFFNKRGEVTYMYTMREP